MTFMTLCKTLLPKAFSRDIKISFFPTKRYCSCDPQRSGDAEKNNSDKKFPEPLLITLETPEDAKKKVLERCKITIQGYETYELINGMPLEFIKTRMVRIHRLPKNVQQQGIYLGKISQKVSSSRIKLSMNLIQLKCFLYIYYFRVHSHNMQMKFFPTKPFRKMEDKCACGKENVANLALGLFFDWFLRTRNLSHWVIDFNTEKRWENSLMGWCSFGDPLSNLEILFSTKGEAITFCQVNKLPYWIQKSKTHKKFGIKSYALNFHHNRRTRISTK